MSRPPPRKRLWLIREMRFLNRIISMSTTWGADPVSGTVLLGGMSVLAWTEDCSSDKKEGEKKKRRCLSGSCVSRKHLAHNNSKKKKKRRNLCLCEHSGTFWWWFLHLSSANHTVELEMSNNLIFFFAKQCPCCADYSFLANQQKKHWLCTAK